MVYSWIIYDYLMTGDIMENKDQNQEKDVQTEQSSKQEEIRPPLTTYRDNVEKKETK